MSAKISPAPFTAGFQAKPFSQTLILVHPAAWVEGQLICSLCGAGIGAPSAMEAYCKSTETLRRSLFPTRSASSKPEMELTFSGGVNAGSVSSEPARIGCSVPQKVQRRDTPASKIKTYKYEVYAIYISSELVGLLQSQHHSPVRGAPISTLVHVVRWSMDVPGSGGE